MPEHRTVKLHDERVIWPAFKSLQAVLELKETTPEYLWESTYQGSINPSQSFQVFKSEWWSKKNRYNIATLQRPVARFISLDTASSTEEKTGAAYTAWVVGSILPDYRIAIAQMGRLRLDMPDLVEHIKQLHHVFSAGVNCKIVIEDKSSGTGALQTLRKVNSIPQGDLMGFNPKVDKFTRWSKAAVWCSLGCVLLPEPGIDFPWLYDAEKELFNVPNSEFLDQADAFAQLILFTEQFLSAGYNNRARAA